MTRLIKGCDGQGQICDHFVGVAWILLVFLILGSPDVSAQHYIPEDTSTVLKLLKISRDSLVISPCSCMLSAEKAILISRQVNYKKGIAKGLTLKGEAEAYLGKPDSSLSDFSSALSIYRQINDKNNIGASHDFIGTSYDEKGVFDKAIVHFDSATKLFLSLNDSEGLARTYSSLGLMMSHMRDFDKAVGYHLASIKAFPKSAPPLLVGSFYSNLAGCYIFQNKFEDALRCLYRCIHICDSMHTTQNLKGAFANMALCFDNSGRKDSAIYYYFKALDLYRQTADLPNEAILLCDIGSSYFELKKYVEAEKYYRESLELARRTSNLTVIFMVNSGLSDVYLKQGDYLKAIEFRDSALVNKDSLFNKERAQVLVELNSKIENREIEHRDMILKKENDLQKIKLQRKDILLYGGSGTLVLLVFSGFLLLRHRKLKANQKLMELEQKQLLAQINPHFIFNCLNSIQQFVVQNDTINANRYLADFAMLMRQTLNNSKDGIISLSREIEYLENYLSFEHMRFEDKFTYSIACDPEISTDNTEIPSMIIQPFVENAIRHGLCSLQTRMGILKISFYIRDKFLFCEVDDNGIGMEEAQNIRQKGFIKYQSHGMDLTQRRLALVSKMHSEDYKITIVNKTGADGQAEGTTIIIKFPYQA